MFLRKLRPLASIFLLVFVFASCNTNSSERMSGHEMMKGYRDKPHSGMRGRGMMMSAEQHETMAQHHKKMAECLKSGKSHKQCFSELSPAMLGMKECTEKYKNKKMTEERMEELRECMMRQKKMKWSR